MDAICRQRDLKASATWLPCLECFAAPPIRQRKQRPLACFTSTAFQIREGQGSFKAEPNCPQGTEFQRRLAEIWCHLTNIKQLPASHGLRPGRPRRLGEICTAAWSDGCSRCLCCRSTETAEARRPSSTWPGAEIRMAESSYMRWPIAPPLSTQMRLWA